MMRRISPWSSVLSLTASRPTVVPLSGSVATSGTGRKGAIAGLNQYAGLNTLGLGCGTGGVVATVVGGGVVVSGSGGRSARPGDDSAQTKPPTQRRHSIRMSMRD